MSASGKVGDIPVWADVAAKRRAGEVLSPLETFVYDNEPGNGFDADEWRAQLAAVLSSLSRASEE